MTDQNNENGILGKRNVFETNIKTLRGICYEVCYEDLINKRPEFSYLMPPEVDMPVNFVFECLFEAMGIANYYPGDNELAMVSIIYFLMVEPTSVGFFPRPDMYPLFPWSGNMFWDNTKIAISSLQKIGNKLQYNILHNNKIILQLN